MYFPTEMVIHVFFFFKFGLPKNPRRWEEPNSLMGTSSRLRGLDGGIIQPSCHLVDLIEGHFIPR